MYEIYRWKSCLEEWKWNVWKNAFHCRQNKKTTKPLWKRDNLTSTKLDLGQTWLQPNLTAVELDLNFTLLHCAISVQIDNFMYSNIETWPHCPSLEPVKILFQWCLIFKLDLIAHHLNLSKFVSMMVNIKTWLQCPSLDAFKIMFKWC